MESEFIRQVIKGNFLLALLGGLAIAFFYGVYEGVGVGVGALLGALNLFLLKHLMANILVGEEKDLSKLFVLLGVKFPIFYGAGFLVMKSGWFSLFSLVLGFSLIFLAIFQKGLYMFFWNKSSESV